MTHKKHSLKDDVGYWLNRLRMVVHTSFEAKIALLGITVPQWCVLVSLNNHDAKSVGELAQFIEVDKGFISRIVEQLVKMELVERQQGKDRRSGVVYLTPKGRTLIPKLIHCAEKNEKEFFKVLSAKEQEELRQLLSKLLNNAGIVASEGWFKDGSEKD
jgi:DNA-binding MarR family transcriptional regulator